MSASLRDRSWSLVAWISFGILVPYGFLILGRFAFADYPWQEATDIGVSIRNGAIVFKVVPIIPIGQTFQLLLSTAIYVAAVWFFARELRRRFGAVPFLQKVPRGEE